MDESVFFGRKVCVSLSGPKIRFWNASAADIPVSC